VKLLVILGYEASILGQVCHKQAEESFLQKRQRKAEVRGTSSSWQVEGEITIPDFSFLRFGKSNMDVHLALAHES
jgi:hypothetical protein